MPPSKADTELRAEQTGGAARTVLVAFIGELSIPFELPAEGSVTIGRSSSCDLPIDHPSVSREHARLHVGVPVTIEDLGSRNGTHVRGVPVAPHKLADVHFGDVIECGDATLLLRRVAARTASAPRADAAARELVVGSDGRFFRLAGSGEEVNLGRRGPLRKVLLALARRRIDEPGVGLSNDDILEAGWPGAKMKHEAGLARVYTTVQRMRALGLQGILVTHDDGYLLDPAVAARIEER
jgi:pSer/pThr/pTyr-binding forkhead associated (FHA) protein